MTRWLALLLLTSCSSPDFSLRGEEGCHQWHTPAPNECSVTRDYGIVECAIPTYRPGNEELECFSPTGQTLSKDWCCLLKVDAGG